MTLQKPCVRIDGGEELYWTDLTLEAGKTANRHVFHVHKETNFILSFWDIHCTDAAGNKVVIRPECTYPAKKTDNDSFGNEGEGAHTLLPMSGGRAAGIGCCCGAALRRPP